MKMKRRAISLMLIFVLIIGTAAVISGCGKKKEVKISNPINVTMNIRYPAKANMDAVKNVKFKVEKKSTVMQAMQIFCNVNDIPLNVDTTNNIIKGINNVNNGDFNAKYVWKFKVNGELCKASPVDKILKSGDILQWIYTKK